VPYLIILSHALVIQGDNDITITTNTNSDTSLLDNVILFPNPRESGSELDSMSNSDDSLDDSSDESP
jgi:hypothetical protein